MQMLPTSGSGSRFSDIHELVEVSKLLGALECPICQDVPFPPIHHCERGHIICSNCKPKLHYCPICKAPFSTGRNYPVESIILNSLHKCQNRANGCPAVVKGEEMESHLKQCSYRGLSTPCHLGRYVASCNKNQESIPLPKYLHHLRESHMMLPSISSKGPSTIFESHVLADVTDTFWLGDYTVFDSSVFIIRQFMRNGVVYFSLGLIGDEQLAKKYLVTVSISSVIDKVSKISWTIPTHSILLKEEEVLDKFAAIVPFSYLKAHSSLITASLYSKTCKKSKAKLHFSVEYKICHNNPK